MLGITALQWSRSAGSLEETMGSAAAGAMLAGGAPTAGLERRLGFASHHSVGSLHRNKLPSQQVPKRTCSMQRNLSPMSGLRGSHCESTGSETSLVLETSVSSHGSSSDLQSHHSHSPLWGGTSSGEDQHEANTSVIASAAVAGGSAGVEVGKRLSNISEDVPTCDAAAGYTGTVSVDHTAAAELSAAAADALLMYPSQTNMSNAGGISSCLQVNAGVMPHHHHHHHYQQQQQSQQHYLATTAAVGGAAVLASPTDVPPNFNTTEFKLKEIERKRHYRVGLNLFNKKPERGIRYLIEKGFLEASPQAVARFLMTRKGLSKNKIGEYLGERQNPFAVQVLECFVREMDLSGMQVDVALRKFQSYFQMPGEAQKVDHVIQMFSLHYADCNPDLVSQFFKNADNILVVAFSIVMLNVDLHNPSLAEHRRMKVDDYIKNLRGVEGFETVDRSTLAGIYERIKKESFRPGSDHVTQVAKVQETIVGAKKPNLVLPHRRLVCYCRLYEVYEILQKSKKTEKTAGQHQREVFLFNDLLLITKIASKKKGAITYSFRQSIALVGLAVTLFSTPHYPFGISLSQRVDAKVVIMLNARNEHDREKFCDDLRESILEMDEMEALRIEAELEKQNTSVGAPWANQAENRDSGVATDDDLPPPPCASNSTAIGTDPAAQQQQQQQQQQQHKQSTPITSACANNDSKPTRSAAASCSADQAGLSGVAADGPTTSASTSSSAKGLVNKGVAANANLSNSLLDIAAAAAAIEPPLILAAAGASGGAAKPMRRGSAGSLDSGMSVSFQSSAASTASRDSSPQTVPLPAGQSSVPQPSAQQATSTTPALTQGSSAVPSYAPAMALSGTPLGLTAAAGPACTISTGVQHHHNHLHHQPQQQQLHLGHHHHHLHHHHHHHLHGQSQLQQQQSQQPALIPPPSIPEEESSSGCSNSATEEVPVDADHIYPAVLRHVQACSSSSAAAVSPTPTHVTPTATPELADTTDV